MKDWLLAEGKSFTDNEAKAKDDPDQEDADDIEKDEDSIDDHDKDEDVKLRDMIRSILKTHNWTYEQLADEITSDTGEEMSKWIIAKLVGGHNSFFGPKGNKMNKTFETFFRIVIFFFFGSKIL